MRRQCTIWQQQDAHAHAFATLTTSYSARIAQTLAIPSALTSLRCTVCHAPHGNADSPHPAEVGFAESGVSCEECHNPARSWLRSHTRPDYTHAQRVASGLRDLQDAYIRATTCVACHQAISPDILQAGHPVLKFELASLTTAEPPHWEEKEAWFGPKTWLVGQAVALREISRELSQGNSTPPLLQEAKARQWLLTQLPGIPAEKLAETDYVSLADWGNLLAKSISQQTWTQARTQTTLVALSATSPSFADPQVSPEEQAARAVQLLPGLSQLSSSLPQSPGHDQITQLSAQIANLQSFNPTEFANGLKKLEADLRR
jgi:hypothetical protein